MNELQGDSGYRESFGFVRSANHSDIDIELQKSEIKRLLDCLPFDRMGWVLNVLRTAELNTSKAVSSKDTGQLSERELQVLIMVANGYSRSEIAIALGISPNTSARHIANIYRKLDISSVAEATTLAISEGLVLMY